MSFADRKSARDAMDMAIQAAAEIRSRFSSTPLVELRAQLAVLVTCVEYAAKLLPDDQHNDCPVDAAIKATWQQRQPIPLVSPPREELTEEQLAATPIVTLTAYHSCERCGFLCPETLAICDSCLPPSKAEEVASDALSAMRGGRSGAV